MTGQVLLTIIMILCFIIPLLLHYHKTIKLFYDNPVSVISTILFVISIIYLILTLIVFILEHWNTPIF
jgi:hypothetical protein